MGPYAVAIPEQGLPVGLLLQDEKHEPKGTGRCPANDKAFSEPDAALFTHKSSAPATRGAGSS